MAGRRVGRVVIEEPELTPRKAPGNPGHINLLIFGTNHGSKEHGMRDSHLPESTIWLGKVVDANDILGITATGDGKRQGRSKTSGNAPNEFVHRVLIDLTDETIELRLNRGQLDGVLRLIEKFRSNELPVPVVIEGQRSEVFGHQMSTRVIPRMNIAQ